MKIKLYIKILIYILKGLVNMVMKIFSFYDKKYKIKDIFYFLFLMNIALFFWPITLLLLWFYINLKIFLFIVDEFILFFTLKTYENKNKNISVSNNTNFDVDKKKHNIRISYITKIFTALNKKMPINILDYANKGIINFLIYFFLLFILVHLKIFEKPYNHIQNKIFYCGISNNKKEKKKLKVNFSDIKEIRFFDKAALIYECFCK